MINTKTIGDIYEEKAAEYLINKGYSIVKRNYRYKYGEIDIIAKKGNMYVATEVKYRKNNRYGAPEEAVTYSKMKKICKTFCSFCLRYKIDINRPIRFDVIAFSGKDCITHYENAFEFVL